MSRPFPARPAAKPSPERAYERPSVRESWCSDGVDTVDAILVHDDLTATEEAVYRSEIR
jgi:hypothetical protein